MSADVRRRCIEPFFTTRNDGSGLGLSVCYGIVERHRGQLEIDSVPQQGTTVRLVFPTCSVAKTRDEMPPVRASVYELPQWRILYIDDDARVRPLVADILHHLGQHVDVAADGTDGLNMLRQAAYHLVITDLGMSGIDGRQVTRLIHQYWPKLPVIMLTGWPIEQAVAQLEPSEEPDLLLQKPPTAEALHQGLSAIARSARRPDVSSC